MVQRLYAKQKNLPDSAVDDELDLADDDDEAEELRDGELSRGSGGQGNRRRLY